MKLGYVCTNFNSSDATLFAIETLCANTGHDIHVVVVDNDSDALEIEKLRGVAAPNVEILELGENVGYFRGLNKGIAHLRKQRPDIAWMVIGNNDLEFSADFCGKLEAILPDIAGKPVISPDIVTGDGEHQNPHVISGISSVREFFYDLYYSNYYVGLLVLKLAKAFRSVSDRSDEEQWQIARPIYQGHGSVYLLGPRFFDLFQDLWAPTFMMSEEYFLSKQLSDVGESVYYEPRITVGHRWHGSLAKLPSRRRWEIAQEAHRVYRKYVKVFGPAARSQGRSSSA